MNKKTVSILICALNEEKNIGLLIQDIQDQKFDFEFNNNFILENITVVSDGSTDKTTEIVKSFQDKDKRINLNINKKRIGKIFSLDKMFGLINTDYIILFDADVRLKTNTINVLVKPILLNNYDLIGGNPIPIKPKSILNIAEQASFFSWLIHQEIKTRHPDSVYSSHGRILLTSKYLYKNLDINGLSTPGDDAFMYLKSMHNFFYEKDAVVIYRMPNSVSDYLKQNMRFRKGKLVKSKSSFGAELIKKEFNIKNKFIIFLKLFFKYPYQSFLWMILYGFGYLKFKLQVQNSTDINKIWGEVKSTK